MIVTNTYNDNGNMLSQYVNLIGDFAIKIN